MEFDCISFSKMIQWICFYILQAFQLIHLLAVQCNINIFFIDWERPRVKASSTSGRLSSNTKNVAESSADGKKTSGTAAKTPDKINTEMAGVSIWRTYFAANEWAEIQSKRKLNIGLQVFGVLFFLKVCYLIHFFVLFYVGISCLQGTYFFFS